jgi:hypothetical protein
LAKRLPDMTSLQKVVAPLEEGDTCIFNYSKRMDFRLAEMTLRFFRDFLQWRLILQIHRKYVEPVLGSGHDVAEEHCFLRRAVMDEETA